MFRRFLIEKTANRLGGKSGSRRRRYSKKILNGTGKVLSVAVGRHDFVWFHHRHLFRTDSLPIVRKTVYAVLFPIYVPLAFFLAFTNEWWQGLNGKITILYVILWPVYFITSFFMAATYEWWEDLKK